jgi:hypothetical protein
MAFYRLSVDFAAKINRGESAWLTRILFIIAAARQNFSLCRMDIADIAGNHRKCRQPNCNFNAILGQMIWARRLKLMVIPARFERATPRLGIWCSILLSYGTTWMPCIQKAWR